MNRRGFFRALASAPFLRVAVPGALLGASFATGSGGVKLAKASPEVIGRVLMDQPLLVPPYVVFEGEPVTVHTVVGLSPAPWDVPRVEIWDGGREFLVTDRDGWQHFEPLV